MLKPFEWKDRPSIIEHLFPVQKISAESFKEQMAGAGKTLTALGSYWKGRKPLILNKACILGTLLPTTDDRLKDLEIFELLMGMDGQSMQKRLEANLPASRHHTVGEYLILPYNEQVIKSKRPEELGESVFDHIWEKVNHHLGTDASSFPELVEQMGIARFGHRPKVADVFCGSGQIPFEAARLGCDVYASDLNPIACMLTWGAFNIVGASKEKRAKIDKAQKKLAEQVQKEIDALGVETDGTGWRAKVYLYCVETICPESGWKVPLIPTLIISKGYRVVARLVPVSREKRYDVNIVYVKTDAEIDEAKTGTVQGGEMVHSPDGVTVYRTKISTLRGDYKDGKENQNRLRLWEKSDFVPRSDDIYQERLYCVQWMRKKPSGRGDEYQFSMVTADDLKQEQKVIDYVGTHLTEWQEKGFVPDMVIEKGYNTDQPIRERGWTHWHHLFNARQLLIGALYRKNLLAHELPQYGRFLDYNAKLCMWDSNPGPGRVGKTQHVFYNQALNTLYNYACRGSEWTKGFFSLANLKSYPCTQNKIVNSHTAQHLDIESDIYITKDT